MLRKFAIALLALALVACGPVGVDILATAPKEVGDNQCQVTLQEQVHTSSDPSYEWWQIDTSGKGNDTKISNHQEYTVTLKHGQTLRVRLIGHGYVWDEQGNMVRDVDYQGLHTVSS